jgi:chromosome segregation ATPase
VFGHERSGTLKQKNITPTLRESKESALNKDLKPTSVANNDYDDSQNTRRTKNSSSAKKMRTSSFGASAKLNDSSFSTVKKNRNKLPVNDFDPSTVKDGLEVIDLEIHDIDQNIPPEELEQDDNETEELLKANKVLRDKVGQIADLVVSAITKASTLRKQISTHRDKPDDPELNSKLKEINRYQKAIMTMKYPKISPNYKMKEMQDQLKILEADISKLEEERAVIKRENSKRNQAYSELKRGTKEQDDRVAALRESMRQEKDHIAKMEELKRLQDAESQNAIEELRRWDNEYRALFEKKLLLKSGKLNSLDEEFEKEERDLAEIQRKKVVKRIAENKVTQLRTKILAQKKKNTDLDKELDEIKKTIKDKLDQNELLSKRAKDLKGMIVIRKSSNNHSHIKTPLSPKLSDEEKAEL